MVNSDGCSVGSIGVMVSCKDFLSTIRRAVIYHEHLKRVVGLFKERFQTSLNPMRAVADTDRYGHTRAIQSHHLKQFEEAPAASLRRKIAGLNHDTFAWLTVEHHRMKRHMQVNK